MSEKMKRFDFGTTEDDAGGVYVVSLWTQVDHEFRHQSRFLR